MKYRSAGFVVVSLVFVAFTFQAAEARSRVPAKVASLIAHLAAEANKPGAHSKGDMYISVTLGKTEYIAGLKSGKVVGQRAANSSDGGIDGVYASVFVNLMDKDKKESAQGASQVLKSVGGKWRRIALSESDYHCADLKGVPASVRKRLKIECN